MIIKNNNYVIDVQKDSHVSWEGKKDSKRFYVKKTISYGKWTVYSSPTEIPAISWEGGTTVNCKCWVERTNTIREGFSTWTETQYHYLIPSFGTLQNGVTLNTTENNKDGWTITFSKRDETSGDLVISGMYQYTDETGRYEGSVKVTQTKRDKYVTKLDNAVITVDNIPASGGTVSSGKLTYRKTFNTAETENATENITFTTVSATTKGVTESGVTDVKTIAAGGTNQKSTTIDGVTLTHPAFTVKQAANVKSVKTAEYKTTESVILSVSPTVVYSSGGTVTFSLSRKYTLHKTVYQYSSGSTSGGGTDTGQGPETVSANQTYTISGISGTSSTTGTTYKIGSSTTARTIKFQTTYDKVKSNEATVTQKLDGPNPSKGFYYTDLKITTFSYATGSSGYHFPASGGTITATNCTLKGTYIWHYISMEGKTSQETVNWQLSDLTTTMYTFTPTSKSADSLSTTTASANNNYATISVTVKNLKHTYDTKQYDVKNNSGTVLTTSSTATLTRQGNSGTQSTTESNAKLTVSVSPTEYDYKGGSATLKAIMAKTYNVTWTSGSKSTKDIDTTVTDSTSFSGTYRVGSSTTDNSITVSGSSVTIPNLGTSKDGRKYTFTGRYNGYTDTATLSQTGNTTTYTVTFHINNDYAKWYNGSQFEKDTTVTRKFSEGTSYTDLKPSQTPTWIAGSNYKYNFSDKYSTSTTGSAVSSSSTLQKDLDLYCIWNADTNGYIKVIWDPNNGTLKKSSGNSSTTSSIYHYYNSGKVQVQPADEGYNNTPTRTSYTFLGWKDTDLRTMPYTFDNLKTFHTFTANYTTTSKTIYWNSNGGQWSNNDTERSETKDYGENVSSYTPTPSKTNTADTTYSFKGWSLKSNGDTVGFPYTITTTNDSIRFYAIYNSSTVQHTVTWTSYPANIKIFKDDGTSKQNKYDHNTEYKSLTAAGVLKSFPFYNNTTEANSTIKYSDSNNWYTTATGSTTLTNNTTKLTSDITVYRHITVEYKVTFNANGGQKSSSDTTASWFIWKTGSLNLGSYTPYRSTYNFSGWAENNSSATSSSTSTVTISSSTTYYAVWTKQKFTVTWNLQGGTYNGSTTNPTQSVEYGATVSFSTYTPTKSGYTFQGWAETSSATSGSTSGNSSAITSNKTFYAIWKSAALTPILLILAS